MKPFRKPWTKGAPKRLPCPVCGWPEEGRPWERMCGCMGKANECTQIGYEDTQKGNDPTKGAA
jgi:hypothetical protein